MKAAVYYTNGGPEVLRYETVPDPECPPGCVLVRARAISLEGGDLLHRAETPPPSTPYVVGYAAAGEVVALGEGVTDLALGQVVTTTFFAGSHAELRAVPVQLAWPVPDGVDIGAAAAIPVGFATADEALTARARVQPGEVVLIHAAASGVGVAAVQLAKAAGATVIAVATSRPRLDRLAGIGADHLIDRQTEDIVSRVHEITEGRGADVVLDPVGSTVQSSIDASAERGRIVLVGNAGRGPMVADFAGVLFGNRTVHGVQLGQEVLTDRVQGSIRRLLDRLADGSLQVLVDRRFPLSEAAQAHAYVESRAAVGRVLLIP
ncbi:quinone oxidoreductase family protein [Amycolatopsis kentuckyensis]|uniref:quinone oxidoreductase family protein n=1 Tax=Amycolatopsis kentuckyensis TaxID=218823 RepID=UPI003561E916